jgi:glycogen debranching enzyme
MRTAEVFEAIGDRARAQELRGKAAALYRRFNEAFWDDQTGFYALALDGDKKPVMTVASNPGHCLWSGIVPRERAARVVDRLMQPDMWCGWGVRTLSSRHPAFNPFSYQNGSVWPHDNGLIALGMKRYGFAAQAGEVARAICAAASFFMSNRLPELFAGIDRGDVSFPLRYLGANVPQAWATGTVFALIEALIGFKPDAPHGRLEVDPDLPEWLPDLELCDLRLGDRRIDLRFYREGQATRFEVTKGDPRNVGWTKTAEARSAQAGGPA